MSNPYSGMSTGEEQNRGKGRVFAQLDIIKGARESKKAEFLDQYAIHFSISKAAQLVEISRECHYQWLANDEQYRVAFEEAREKAIDALEDEAMRRAKEGTERPTTVAGQREVIREYSDNLTMFMLKGHRPGKYRDRQVLDIPQLGELVDRLSAGRKRVEQYEQAQLPHARSLDCARPEPMPPLEQGDTHK